MKYEVEFWELEFYKGEDLGYDNKYVTVEAPSEEEALAIAKDENRFGKKFKIFKRFD